jgi:hypothetical protein
MTRLTAIGTASVLGLFGLGCASAPAESRRTSDEEAPRNSGSAIVLEGEDFRGRGQTLLRLMAERVMGMSVNYGGPCPSIQLRGTKSMFGSNDPLIYVDGARALNTCVLDDMSPDPVARVEIYPSGVSHRPGYDFSRNGLILVFVLDGTEG